VEIGLQLRHILILFVLIGSFLAVTVVLRGSARLAGRPAIVELKVLVLSIKHLAWKYFSLLFEYMVPQTWLLLIFVLLSHCPSFLYCGCRIIFHKLKRVNYPTGELVLCLWQPLLADLEYLEKVLVLV
jgi:hypothetical protein